MAAELLQTQFVLDCVLLIEQLPFRFRRIAVYDFTAVDDLDLPLKFLPAFLKHRFAFGNDLSDSG